MVVTINMTLLAELGRFPALGMVIGSSPEAMHQNTEAGAHKLTTTGFDGATGAPTCNRLGMSFFTQSRLETGAPTELGGAIGGGVAINMTLLAELGRFPALGMVRGSSPGACIRTPKPVRIN